MFQANNKPNLIKKQAVINLSRNKSLKRGFQYVNSNHVQDVITFQENENTFVAAKVKSSYREEYHNVKLKVVQDKIEGNCTCISGLGDCHHCVATAIQVGLDQDDSDISEKSIAKKKRKLRYDDIMQVLKPELSTPPTVVHTTPPIRLLTEIKKFKKKDLQEELKKEKI